MKYHKIQTVFYRDPDTKHKTLLAGAWSKPEFEYLAENTWVFTEKIDGTNIRVIWDGNKIRFAGKNENSSIPARLYEFLQCNLGGTSELLGEMFPDGCVLYGEGYGGKIQGAQKTYGGTERFILFDVYANGVWICRDAVESVADALDIPVVPIIYTGNLYDAIRVARDGFTSKFGEFTAEGIVARPMVEMFNNRGERIITKIKHKDFAKVAVA